MVSIKEKILEAINMEREWKLENRLLSKYDRISEFSEGFCAVSKDGKYWGYVNKKLKEICECKYFIALPFYFGQAKVMRNGKWGLIDKEGKEICPPKYDEIMYFINGFCIVILDNKEGFIDKNGNEICSLKYDSVRPFDTEGYAAVCIDGKYSIINTSGEEMCDFKFDYVYDFHNGVTNAVLEGENFWIDTHGNVIDEPEF